MSFPHYIFISVLLAGCAAPRHADSPSPVPVAAAHLSRSVESFQFIGPETTMPQVIAKLGKPDRDAGSGIHIFVYALSDGTEVKIGSADGSHVLYVRHGADIVFEKR